MKYLDPLAVALARSMRPQATLIPFLICCVVLAIRGNSLWAYIGASMILIATYGFVTVYNDLSDYKIDVANKRFDIPLVDGTISSLQLKRLMIGLFAVAFSAVLLFGTQSTLLWMSVYMFLGYLYSGPAHAKSHPIYSPIILGICYGAMPILLGYSMNGNEGAIFSPLVLGILVASFLFSAAIILLKDFKDETGDRKFGKRTFLVAYGAETTQHAVLLGTSMAYAILALNARISVSFFILFAILLAWGANIFLLLPKNVVSDKRRRAKHAFAARLLFFMIIAGFIIWVIK